CCRGRAASPSRRRGCARGWGTRRSRRRSPRCPTTGGRRRRCWRPTAIARRLLPACARVVTRPRCTWRRPKVPASVPFDYAIVRVVPRVEREEFVNVGVVVHAPTRGFLGCALRLDRGRLGAFAPAL